MKWAFSSIERDLSSGFKLVTFLHNHPVFPFGRYDCAGTCVPSDPDLNAFGRGINRKAQEFWITNGHDSFRFRNSELRVFTDKAGMMEVPEGQVERPEGPLDLLLEPGMEPEDLLL